MNILKMNLKSLKHRSVTTTLVLISLMLTTSLLLLVFKFKNAAYDSFTQSISQTDLIVGARSGPTNLILYTVFNLGSATNNISWATYEELSKNPKIQWTIPYSLGDSHRGYRVVGTNRAFLDHYHYQRDQKVQLADGEWSEHLWQAVIGAEVAKSLKYTLGQKIVLAHGVTKGVSIIEHDDKPFTVTGILKSTGTQVDRAVYISLKSLEAIHIDWKNGAIPQKDQVIAASSIQEENLKVGAITAFFVGAQSRLDTLSLQREINTYTEEPLLAIIPGVVLSELWQALSYVEKAMIAISWAVLIVGFISVIISLLTSLQERSHEMSILRALGARPSQLAFHFMFESFILSVVGILLGWILANSLILILSRYLVSEFGLYLKITTGSVEVILMVIMLGLSLLISALPTLIVIRRSLKKGLLNS